MKGTESKVLGGPYCSRDFSGMCIRCDIRGVDPGQASGYQGQPDCPYTILSTKDYSADEDRPTCKTRNAGDSCCLYMADGCDGSDDPLKASLDTDGVAMIAYRCYKESSSEAMIKFAQRVAKEAGGVLNSSSALQD